jgi:hypothetical protein
MTTEQSSAEGTISCLDTLIDLRKSVFPGQSMELLQKVAKDLIDCERTINETSMSPDEASVVKQKTMELHEQIIFATKSAAVHIAEFSEQRAVHEKYAIDAVPAVLMVDMQGVVHASFLGPVSATDLWAALARARDGLAQKTADEHCH